jgi:hypothetical protein
MHSVGVYGQRERGSIQGASWTILQSGMLKDTSEDTSFRGFGRQISEVADLNIFAAIEDIFSSQSSIRPSTMLNSDYKEKPKRQ